MTQETIAFYKPPLTYISVSLLPSPPRADPPRPRESRRRSCTTSI